MPKKPAPNRPKPQIPEQDKKASAQITTYSEDEKSTITLLQGFLGATAFLSAALFYFGWIYNRRYFEVFGISGYTIRYPTQDYILNAKSILAIGLFVVSLLFLVLFTIDLAKRGLRFAISVFSGVVLLVVLIYLFRDIWLSLAANSSGGMNYKTLWATLVGVVTLLLYGIIAPTLLFNKVVASRRYTNFARLIVWSSLAALALLMLSWTANSIGKIEGRLDASINSRLLSISIATIKPLGFGIQADKTIQDDDGNSTYIYYNLRYLTQNEGLLYIFRPEQDIIIPLVHVIPVEKAQVISLGPNVKTLDPIFVIQTPVP